MADSSTYLSIDTPERHTSSLAQVKPLFNLSMSKSVINSWIWLADTRYVAEFETYVPYVQIRRARHNLLDRSVHHWLPSSMDPSKMSAPREPTFVCTFPHDIQRLIFEQAAFSDKRTAPRLALISRQVHGWSVMKLINSRKHINIPKRLYILRVEPIIYQIVTLRYPETKDSFYGLWKSRPSRCHSTPNTSRLYFCHTSTHGKMSIILTTQ
jgi:hypothetical protein